MSARQRIDRHSSSKKIERTWVVAPDRCDVTSGTKPELISSTHRVRPTRSQEMPVVSTSWLVIGNLVSVSKSEISLVSSHCTTFSSSDTVFPYRDEVRLECKSASFFYCSYRIVHSPSFQRKGELPFCAGYRKQLTV